MPGQFLAGAYPGDADEQMAESKLQSLYNAGIRHVINLMQPTETAHGVPFRPYAPSLTDRGVTIASYPIDDLGVPSRSTMSTILDDIDSSIASNEPVYVHCWGGRGRTGTVVGCWLRRHNLAGSDQVLHEISRLRRGASDSRTPSPDTAAQRDFIQSWSEPPAPASARQPDSQLVLSDRLAGAIWGHLVGDALGVPYEFKPPSEIGDVVWGKKGSHGQPPGTWSDDGGLMLALLDSLLSSGFDPPDQGRRSTAWLDGPDYKPGNLFDIGRTTSAALRRFKQGMPAEECGGSAERDNGNGSLMRILPVALVGRSVSESTLFEWACRASRLTHAHPRSQVACAVYCFIVRSILGGQSDRDQALALAFAAASNYAQGTLIGELEALRTYERRSGASYVLDSFWSAWDSFRQSDSYPQSVEHAIRFGNDTDSTAAIAGGLAGLYWGIQSIPNEWIQNMRGQEIVRPLVDKLIED